MHGAYGNNIKMGIQPLIRPPFWLISHGSQVAATVGNMYMELAMHMGTIWPKLGTPKNGWLILITMN